METKYRIIDDPLKKMCIDNDIPLSLIEIFITRKELYNELCKRNNIYNLKVAIEIIDFFKITPRPSRKKSLNNKVKHYTGKWITYKNSQKKKIAQLKAMEGLLQELVEATAGGNCVWEEKISGVYSGITKKRFATKFKGNIFYMEVMTYRNRDGELKGSLELQREEKNGIIKTCPKDFNGILYKMIQKEAIVKNSEKISYVKKCAPEEEKRKIEINHGDFVVRTNLFRCYHKEHLVEEIIGILKIVTPQGMEIEEKIPCAYCPECNCSYILTSEYNRISEKGILLCQLLDKDEYYKAGIPNKFNGVSESLLMRNGYNVKANVGLTDIQRQIILKNIIDNGILTPHRIASYIDMFIAQKKNLPQYNEAILKWQRDKKYVLAYKNKRSVEIESIKK